MNAKRILNITIITICVFSVTSSCVRYDADPFTGRIIPRVSGYTSGVTNDLIYFNLRTGQIFNENRPNEDITEGEQYDRLDWDLAFCGYHMRTNSGTSGCGKGGAVDLGYGNYDKWTSLSQLSANSNWVTDTDSDVYVTYSQSDWSHYLVIHHMDLNENPWFDPNSGPQRKLTSANKLLDNCISLSGPPMSYDPSYHVYVVRTADGKRYFKLMIVSWYNTNSEIDGDGGQMSYYIDELKKQ